jgi:hypothetical protein
MDASGGHHAELAQAEQQSPADYSNLDARGYHHYRPVARLCSAPSL